MNTNRGFVCLALACATLLPACGPKSASGPSSGDSLPIGQLQIVRGGEVKLELEVQIADTSDERAKGLSGVRELDDDAGMAFLLELPTRNGFWMKDTLIPLDIAFWDANYEIVDIIQMEPCKAGPCPLYTPRADYLGAVESNRGTLNANGVQIGDLIRLLQNQKLPDRKQG